MPSLDASNLKQTIHAKSDSLLSVKENPDFPMNVVSGYLRVVYLGMENYDQARAYALKNLRRKFTPVSPLVFNAGDDRVTESIGERVAALRRAQAEHFKKNGYAHPFFWAPFVLTGDWRWTMKKKAALIVILAGAFMFQALLLSAEERKLTTSEEFIEKLSQPASTEKPRLRLRGMRVSPGVAAPEVTVQILFKFGSTEIADAFSKRQLDEAGKALSSTELSGFRFEIAGHTDAVGSDEFNRALSQQRAAAVKSYLCDQYRIAADRLEARGYGESQPAASNATDQGRASNRRVVFKRLDE